MNHSTIVFLINDSVRAINAVYDETPGAKPDVFKTFDTSIKVGDLVVVQSGTRHEMTTVKVKEVDIDLDVDTTKDIKWVVQKIDTEAFNVVLDQEKEAIAAVHSAEKKRKKDALRKSLFADHEDKINALQLASPEEVTE